ncbi:MULTISPECIES: glutamate--tRNA ligase [Ornithinimicrobium]|jgi:glutamyl-tRNA synthetase|uniref:Glutamate--tRNA ligase n=1 Tax=Ornithinimicrobium kibberense TaxID=282060 RepID=A0ABV5UZ20_9MICO|nr:MULTISPECIES: glutamate--tRNA ligase [Ornithinimicrobium]OLT21030.1 glutamate--tRNA ligase [Ornithinimicrobium sp. CNJ-824]
MTTNPVPAAPHESEQVDHQVTGPDVRVRFCPSPTGTPHVGMARTALFNWAFARHHGGTFVFRLEDTDAARDSAESADQLQEAMSWLGLDYDEGPGVGGPYGPYRQSERRDVYADVAARLLEAGLAYESFSTPEEVEERHRAAGRDPKLGYDNHDRDLDEAQRAAFRAEGREPVLRLRMPDEDITFVDLVRGEVTFRAGSVPDFVIVRGNGQPLYTLVNPVDDAMMRITHVIRGEDLLSSTPRQIALYRALVRLGVAERVPTFAHLPLVLGEGSKKLSKRDPQSDLFRHRERGFVREGMINYLALLGWAIGPDRDVFTPDELVAAFDVHDVNPNPARWDQKKAEAINADHLRMLPLAEFTSRLLPVLREAGVLGPQSGMGELARLEAVAELIQTRVQVLSEAVPLVAPFYVRGEELPIADDARAQLKEDAGAVLDAADAALEQISGAYPKPLGGGVEWTAARIEQALREALVDGLGLKPRFAFGPLRTAVSGQRISPPLFESMEILGKDETLARLRRLRAEL